MTRNRRKPRVVIPTNVDELIATAMRVAAAIGTSIIASMTNVAELRNRILNAAESARNSTDAAIRSSETSQNYVRMRDEVFNRLRDVLIQIRDYAHATDGRTSPGMLGFEVVQSTSTSGRPTVLMPSNPDQFLALAGRVNQSALDSGDPNLMLMSSGMAEEIELATTRQTMAIQLREQWQLQLDQRRTSEAQLTALMREVRDLGFAAAGPYRYEAVSTTGLIVQASATQGDGNGQPIENWTGGEFTGGDTDTNAAVNNIIARFGSGPFVTAEVLEAFGNRSIEFELAENSEATRDSTFTKERLLEVASQPPFKTEPNENEILQNISSSGCVYMTGVNDQSEALFDINLDCIAATFGMDSPEYVLSEMNARDQSGWPVDGYPPEFGGPPQVIGLHPDGSRFCGPNNLIRSNPNWRPGSEIPAGISSDSEINCYTHTFSNLGTVIELQPSHQAYFPGAHFVGDRQAIVDLSGTRQIASVAVVVADLLGLDQSDLLTLTNDDRILNFDDILEIVIDDRVDSDDPEITEQRVREATAQAFSLVDDPGRVATLDDVVEAFLECQRESARVATANGTPTQETRTVDEVVQQVLAENPEASRDQFFESDWLASTVARTAPNTNVGGFLAGTVDPDGVRRTFVGGVNTGCAFLAYDTVLDPRVSTLEGHEIQFLNFPPMISDSVITDAPNGVHQLTDGSVITLDDGIVVAFTQAAETLVAPEPLDVFLLASQFRRCLLSSGNDGLPPESEIGTVEEIAEGIAQSAGILEDLIDEQEFLGNLPFGQAAAPCGVFAWLTVREGITNTGTDLTLTAAAEDLIGVWEQIIDAQAPLTVDDFQIAEGQLLNQVEWVEAVRNFDPIQFDEAGAIEVFVNVLAGDESSVDVSFVNQTNGTVLEADDVLTVIVNAEDPNGEITSVTLFVDGAMVSRVEGRLPYSWSANDSEIQELSVGDHTLKAVAESDSGETGEAEVVVTVANQIVAPAESLLQLIGAEESFGLDGNVSFDQFESAVSGSFSSFSAQTAWDELHLVQTRSASDLFDAIGLPLPSVVGGQSLNLDQFRAHVGDEKGELEIQTAFSEA